MITIQINQKNQNKKKNHKKKNHQIPIQYPSITKYMY